MFKVAVMSSLVLLSGCSVYNDRSIPSAVTSMPRDCANERAILDWLDYQAEQKRGWLTNGEVYAQDQRTIKYHKWRFKYICNSTN
jgi:hypothetical protein